MTKHFKSDKINPNRLLKDGNLNTDFFHIVNGQLYYASIPVKDIKKEEFIKLILDDILIFYRFQLTLYFEENL